MSRARLLSFTYLLLLLFAAPRTAVAQEQPPPPPFLPRQVTWSWDKTFLRLSVNYKEVVDNTTRKKLNSGIPTLIVLTASIFESGSKTPLDGVLLLKSCRVIYDVWDEVYAVEITQNHGTSYSPAIATLEGVMRKCTQLDKVQVIERTKLKPGGLYEIKAIVDINPISPDVIARIKRWISRPKGTATVGAGDALFGSFVGLFVTPIGNADRTFRFSSRNLIKVPLPKPAK